jgi:cytoskeleton protein RodZ
MTDEAKQMDMDLGLGHLLQMARTEAGLSIEDVADHLRLTKDVVSKMEADAYEVKDLTVFVRGYIRAYAKYVKISEQKVEDYFSRLGVLDKPDSVSPAKFEIRQNRKRPMPIKIFIYAVVVILVVLVLVWLFFQKNNDTFTNTNNLAKTTVSKTVSGHKQPEAVPMTAVKKAAPQAEKMVNAIPQNSK